MKKCLSGIFALLILTCRATTFSFSQKSDYAKAVPVGWTVDNTSSISTAKPYLNSTQPREPIKGDGAMSIVFSTAEKNSELFLAATNAIADVAVCDNFVYSITVYVEPKGSATKIDRVQPMISTDGGKEYLPIGDSIAFKDESISKAGWKTYVFTTNIQNAASKKINVGLKAISGGRGTSQGYVKSISADYKVCAMVKGFYLIADGQVYDPTSLIPNISNLQVRAEIDLNPVDDEDKLRIVENGVVFEIASNIGREKIILTNNVEDGWWYSDVLPSLDAGRSGDMSVLALYESLERIATLDPTNEFGVATNVISKSFKVGKLGSVWLNEISANTIELCGTTNRIYRDGWTISVSGAVENMGPMVIPIPYADLNGEFGKTIYKTGGVVGLACITGIDLSEVVYPVTISLINPDGIAEDRFVLMEPPHSSWSRVNCALWNEKNQWSYDWTGTAGGGVFTWANLEESTIGDVNPGQGFKTPANKTINVTAIIGAEDEVSDVLPYANVALQVDDFKNSNLDSDLVTNKLADSSGVASFSLAGWVSDLTTLFVHVKADAFGWQSPMIDRDVPRTEDASSIMVNLSPSTAFEDFQSKLAASWVNEGTMKDRDGLNIVWEIFNDKDKGTYLRLNGSRADGTDTVKELRCSNYLSTEGKRWLNISCLTKNKKRDSVKEKKDRLTFVFGEDSAFSGEPLISSVISDKNPNIDDEDWYEWINTIELSDSLATNSHVFVKLHGVAAGVSQSELAIKNLRIAFQDMVEVKDFRRNGTEKLPAFDIKVNPLCAAGQCVSNVSAQLVMDVNGTVFTNDAVVAGAVTNDLFEPTTFTVSPEVISAGLQKALGYSQLREHDTVKYWAIVNYYADSRDPNPEKEWEQCIFPDNRMADGENRWVVEGAYKVDEAKVAQDYSYSVPGGPISQNEGVELFVDDPTKAKFSVRAYDEAGITNVTVRLSTAGEEDKVFTTNVTGANCFDYDVVATGLVANAKYVVSVTGVNANGQLLTQNPFVFEFETLPEMPTAAIEAVSTSELNLTVSGKAAGYVVDAAGWEQSNANTWMKGERSPNTLLEETILIYGTNSLGMVSVTNVFEASCYTLAAVATKAPVIEKGTVTVEVGADQDYVASDDDNPEGTEYAVRVTTSNGGDTLVTNGVGKAIWKTLKAWHDEPETLAEPTIDLTATNVFSFVTRNFDEIVTPNGKPVTVECDFPMTASFLGVGQQADPFGIVAITNVFIDPAKRTGATAEVEYKIGEGEWTSVSEDPIALSFDQIAQTNQLAWNAWAAVGQKEGVYAYQLHARVVSGPRTSEWTETSGTLDFVKPTATLFESTTPDAFNVLPMKVTVTFSEPVVDFTSAAITVDGDGMAGEPMAVAGQDNTYTFDVTPNAQGQLKVQIKTGQVKDRFGNGNVATDVLTKTFDVEAPKWDEPPITGTPANGSATNGTWYALAAHATDNLTAITYHWSFDQQTWKTGAEFKGDVEEENKYTVYVYATDAAGNVSTTNEWSWTYDKSAPAWNDPAITGTPANGSHTNKAHFALTASAGDATDVTYYWSFDEQKWTAGQKFEDDVTDEKFYTVHVYAVDAADNVSTTNTWSWTYDRTPPDKPEISGSPANNSVTTNMEYALQAQSYDKLSQYTYHWTLGETVGHEDLFNGKVTKDDVYHASVYVVDEAGNVSETNFWNWTVDTTDPTEPVVSGTPGNNGLTNVVSFAYTAKADDKTKLKFYWKFGEYDEVVKEEDETFDESGLEGLDDLKDGVYAVSCYAVDEAKNVSKTNTIHWTLDRTPPKVTLDSATDDPFGKGTEFLEVSVVFSEPVVGFCERSVFVDNKAQVVSFEQTGNKDDTSYLVKIRPGDDGLITVKIEGEQVKDRAGNWNVASEPLTRTYDTQPPENFTFEATPKNTEVVATSNFNFEVSATDTTTVTYYWKTNAADYVALSAEKKDGAWVANFEGLVSEGTNTLSVYGTDKLGNPTVTNSIWWVVDTIAPTVPVIEGEPADGAYTKEQGFSYTAKSEDATILTYFWTLNGGDETEKDAGEAFAGSGLADGGYTVSVYAKDEAGNVSATTNWTWTIDTVPPEVALSSSTPTTFNEYKVPLIVDVEFSEPVVGFNGDCVTVTRGAVTNWTGSGSSYTVYIDPDEEGDKEAFVPVSVMIVEGAVTDPAGNGNEVSNVLDFKNVTKLPTVTLTTETPDVFNSSKLPFVVTAEFVRGKKLEPAIVTNFTAAAVSVENGTVSDISPNFATNIYTFIVTPKGEGVITVQIPEEVVADEAGNLNEASDSLTRTYDNSDPTDLKILGTPEAGKVTASQEFAFSAEAEDKTALTYYWTLTTPSGVAKKDYASTNFVSSAVSILALKGTNTVSVYAIDAAGNKCLPVTHTWVVDFEPPENLTLSGTPGQMGETNVTSETSFAYTASATDDTKIKYHWLTNGVEVVDNLSTELVGTAIEGTNTVSVYATDEADNVSVTNTILWVVDTIAPTVPVVSGEPADGAITQQTGYSYTATSEDATKVEFWWLLDGAAGVRALPGVPFAGDGLADGAYSVSVYATDEAGNKSDATNWTWTVDTTKPTDMNVTGLPISDDPTVIAVTNGNDFAFTASATDATALKFHWATNGVDVTNITSSNFVGQVGEGTNTVSVYAEDAAGNVCDPITRTWVVDTIAPTVPVISGAPADKSVTKEQGYSYTATSEDATKVEFWWSLDGADGVRALPGVPFVGDGLADGAHSVSVYAKDEAGNESSATNWMWTVDTTKPTDIKVWGLPISDEKIVVTNGNDFAFEASATDATALRFHWATNGVVVTDNTSSNFVGRVGEGTNTVSVCAEDAAGNVCDPVERTWVVDTIDPTVPSLEGDPKDGAITQETGYSYTATSEDATKVEFWWSLDGADGVRALPGVPFAGDGLADGAHSVSVYAKDEAGNESSATNWMWTVDTTKPTDIKVWGLPISDEKIVVTNGNDFAFEASATDATALRFHWATNGVAVTDITSSNFVGQVGEGTNTVSVYAEDAAGNVCDSIARIWVVDTIAPTVPVISGEPADKSVTQEQGYSYTAESEDATVLTYTWKLDGGDETEKNAGEAFSGGGLADGVHQVAVYATDEAGNESAATNWTWTVDTTKPTDLQVWGLPISEDPEVIVLTNGCDFVFTASANDATALKFIWATNGVTATGCTASNFVGKVSEGTNTVTVYAKDAAGNACDPIERKWVVDIMPPSNVVFKTELPADKVINLADVTPNGFKVLVDFSEPVTGFTLETVKVTNGNGEVTAVETNDASHYVAWVMPAQDGEITLKVEANEVKDLAGNGNVASETLSRTCDLTPPTVTITGDQNPFTPAFAETFEVAVTFSEPVSDFTAESVSVENCQVQTVTGSGKDYTVVLIPNEGTNCVWIAKGVVTDSAGNPNTASDSFKRVCDNTKPKDLNILGKPEGDETTSPYFKFTATSVNLSPALYNWTLDGVVQKDSDGMPLTDSVLTNAVPLVPGEHTVTLRARSTAGWSKDTFVYTWTVLEPVKPDNVDFGDGVFLAIDPETHETNEVRFTAVDFHPGADSTVTMSGFGVEPEKTDITGLKMKLMVSETIDGERWPVSVDAAATFDTNTRELTVTIPREETLKSEDPAEPYPSLFFFGVDNEDGGK